MIRGPKDAPIILYPTYFDSKCSRADGRKVSKDLAVPDPVIDDIAKAVASCGWRALIDRKHHYPKVWYKREGRVLIPTEDVDLPHKTEILAKVGAKLKKRVEGKGEYRKRKELAREMVDALITRIPDGRNLNLVGDGE